MLIGAKKILRLSQQIYWVILATGLHLVLSSARAEDTGAEATAAALEQIKAGNYQSASVLAERTLRQFPNNIELWNLLGIARTELHQPSSAKNAFEHGLRLAPDSVSLNENMGFLFYREADYASAKKYLGRAVQLGSANPGVAFSLAAAKLRTGEQVEALTVLKSLEGALRNLSSYWEERGRAEMLHDPAAAEASFARAITLAPGSAVALNGAASATEKQGLDEKALAYLIQCRKANPDDIATLAHFGAVCIRRDLGPDALDALNKAHALQPSNTAVLYLLARANISVQNWQTAYDLFEQFSKHDPSFAPAYYAMGWLALKLGRPQDARRQLERCLSIAPNMADPRYELAQLDMDAGQADTAEKLLRSVLAQKPGHANANLAMGDLMMRKGALNEAQRYLETAVRADPNSGAAHYKLSILLSRRHETGRAAEERTIATNLNAQAKETSKTQLRLALPEMEGAEAPQSQ